MPNHVKPYSRFTDFDISLFKSGKHFRLYEHFGSHIVEHDGEMGVYFAVYAPAAKVVLVKVNAPFSGQQVKRGELEIGN